MAISKQFLHDKSKTTYCGISLNPKGTKHDYEAHQTSIYTQIGMMMWHNSVAKCRRIYSFL